MVNIFASIFLHILHRSNIRHIPKAIRSIARPRPAGKKDILLLRRRRIQAKNRERERQREELCTSCNRYKEESVEYILSEHPLYEQIRASKEAIETRRDLKGFEGYETEGETLTAQAEDDARRLFNRAKQATKIAASCRNDRRNPRVAGLG